MSERPFMQLYVSDFIGDTLHLSTEQVGAYLLLLMAMWNAGGELPDDEAKLARIVRMSVKKWRAVASDLLTFFERADGAVRHNRLTKELLKSEGKSKSRASAGAEGGRAKALKDKQPPVANATDLPWHSPEARDQKEKEPLAQQPEAARREPPLLDRLFDANGLGDARLERHPGLVNIASVLGWISAGYDLELDILPAIRSKPNRSARSWTYFEGRVLDYARQRRGADVKPAPPDATPEAWATILEHWRSTGDWNFALGPPPGSPGCRVPAELQRAA